MNVRRYIAFLFDSGFAYPTILSCLAALTYWIRYKNWPLVTQSYIVTQSLKGVHALSYGPRHGKFPITPDILRLLCHALHHMGWDSTVVVHLKAMFLLSYFAFLRVGELCGSQHAVLIDNLWIQRAYITIQFPSYKFSMGHCPSLFIPARDTDLCPVKALSAYIQLHGSQPGPLFLDCIGHPCTIAHYRVALVKVVAAAGLSDHGIKKPHSFRVGAATAAAALGIPEETIQRMGRWTSRDFIQYIKFQINRL